MITQCTTKLSCICISKNSIIFPTFSFSLQFTWQVVNQFSFVFLVSSIDEVSSLYLLVSTPSKNIQDQFRFCSLLRLFDITSIFFLQIENNNNIHKEVNGLTNATRFIRERERKKEKVNTRAMNNKRKKENERNNNNKCAAINRQKIETMYFMN